MGAVNSKSNSESQLRRNTISGVYDVQYMNSLRTNRLKQHTPKKPTISLSKSIVKTHSSSDINPEFFAYTLQEENKKPSIEDPSRTLVSVDCNSLNVPDDAQNLSNKSLVSLVNYQSTSPARRSHKNLKFESLDTIIRKNNTETLKSYFMESKIARSFFSPVEEKEMSIDELYAATKDLNRELQSKIKLLHTLEIKELSEDSNDKIRFKSLLSKALSFYTKYEGMYNSLSQSQDTHQESEQLYELMQDIATDLKFLKSLFEVYQEASQKSSKLNNIMKSLREMWHEKEKKHFGYLLYNTVINTNTATNHRSVRSLSYNHRKNQLDSVFSSPFANTRSSSNKYLANMAKQEAFSTENTPNSFYSFNGLRKVDSKVFPESLCLLDQDSSTEINSASCIEATPANDSLETLTPKKDPTRKASKSLSFSTSPKVSQSTRSGRVLLCERGFIPRSNSSYKNADTAVKRASTRGTLTQSGRKRSQSLINSSFAVENLVSVTCRTKSVVGSSNMTLIPNSNPSTNSSLRRCSLVDIPDYYNHNNPELHYSCNQSQNSPSISPLRFSSNLTFEENESQKGRYSLGNDTASNTVFNTDNATHDRFYEQESSRYKFPELNSKYSPLYDLHSAVRSHAPSRKVPNSSRSIATAKKHHDPAFRIKKQASPIPFPTIPEMSSQYEANFGLLSSDA